MTDRGRSGVGWSDRLHPAPVGYLRRSQFEGASTDEAGRAAREGTGLAIVHRSCGQICGGNRGEAAKSLLSFDWL